MMLVDLIEYIFRLIRCLSNLFFDAPQGSVCPSYAIYLSEAR